MKIFKNDVTAINDGISAFNIFLSPSNPIPKFDFDSMMKEKHCVEVIHGNWNDWIFPHSEKKGVYFVFGHGKKDIQKRGLYIGKASFDSTIGTRLYKWLHPYRPNSHYIKKYRKETYIMDYIAAIDLDSGGLSFMAPALEEFLINALYGKLNLLNGIGNKKGKKPSGKYRRNMRSAVT